MQKVKLYPKDKDLFGKEPREIMICDPDPSANPQVKKFRAYDDDGNLYFEGKFADDDYCDPQIELLGEMEGLWGVTRIEVWDGEKNKWELEIS